MLFWLFVFDTGIVPDSWCTFTRRHQRIDCRSLTRSTQKLREDPFHCFHRPKVSYLAMDLRVAQWRTRLKFSFSRMHLSLATSLSRISLFFKSAVKKLRKPLSSWFSIRIILMQKPAQQVSDNCCWRFVATLSCNQQVGYCWSLYSFVSIKIHLKVNLSFAYGRMWVWEWCVAVSVVWLIQNISVIMVGLLILSSGQLVKVRFDWNYYPKKQISQENQNASLRVL